MNSDAYATHDRLTPRELAYGALALLGLGATVYFNATYVAQGGNLLDPVAFFRLGFVNPAASSLTADLFVAFLAFALWVIVESRRIGMRRGWLYPLIALVTAFAFVFPLYLLLRERHLRRRQEGA